MSVHLISRVWKLRLGEGSLKLVLLKLADNSNDTGICWPSVDTICKDCELGRSTVFRKLTELNKLGFVKNLCRPGKSNAYQICLPDPSQIGTGDTSKTRPKLGLTRPKSGPHPSQIGTTPVPNRDPIRNRTVKEPSLNLSMQKEEARRLVKLFREKFEHYPRTHTEDMTKKELAAATVLLASSSINEILDLAQATLTDSWKGHRQWVGSLQSLLGHFGELRARYSAPSRPQMDQRSLDHIRKVTSMKTPAELEEQWQQHLERCRRDGRQPDQGLNPANLQ